MFLTLLCFPSWKVCSRFLCYKYTGCLPLFLFPLISFHQWPHAEKTRGVVMKTLSLGNLTTRTTRTLTQSLPFPMMTTTITILRQKERRDISWIPPIWTLFVPLPLRNWKQPPEVQLEFPQYVLSWPNQVLRRSLLVLLERQILAFGKPVGVLGAPWPARCQTQKGKKGWLGNCQIVIMKNLQIMVQ